MLIENTLNAFSLFSICVGGGFLFVLALAKLNEIQRERKIRKIWRSK